MSLSTFNLTIVTLLGSQRIENLTRITFETELGELTVLPHHQPLLTILKPGILEYEDIEGKITSLAVSGGFGEVTRDGNISFMLDSVEHSESIDLASAERARDRAKEMLQKKDDLSEVDFARFESMLEHEMARVRIATKGGRR